MIRPLDTFKADSAKEIFRDGLLYAGQAAAIVYEDGRKTADIFAIQTATALAVGKAWGGFIPRYPLKVGIVSIGRSDRELGKLCDELGDYWKSVGWSADEIDNALRQTLIIKSEGKTGGELAKKLRDEQTREKLDLLILCDLVRCYGDDPEQQSVQTLARFLHGELGSIQSGENPCAILALVGIEDRKRDFFGLRCSGKMVNPKPDSPILRAVYKWARCVFGLEYYLGILALTAKKYTGQLPWRKVDGGDAKGHALNFKRGHFSYHYEEVQLENEKGVDRREEIERQYSCAATLEAELNHLKTIKE